MYTLKQSTKLFLCYSWYCHSLNIMYAIRVPESMPILFALFFLLFLAREFSCCHDAERQSLLKFKRGITEDPAGELSSWVGKDCCSWRGVGCNDSAGHVIHLSLRNIGLEGEISPSLAALEHLTYLDLSSNGFEGPLPVFMHSFHNLRYLNLSNLYLEGPIPHQLGNLSNLRILDLSSNSLLLDDSRWLSRLTSLQQLDLSSISFERGVKWLQALNKLPSLVKLFLYQCIIPDIPLSLPHLNFTSLTTLDLSYTYFNSTLPGWLLNLTSLEFLYLEGNYFAIPFPDAIENKVFLKEVDLSSNHAIRGDPSVRLEELCQLQVLSLSWMNITGDLNQFEGIFSGCIRKSLRILDLGGNQLNGSLPEWLGEFKNLESLSLYSNSFSGPVPTSLGRLSSLQNLMLSDNQLKGNVPESLGGLSSLVSLVLRTNSLEGVVSEKHFANMTKLRELDLRSNSLALKVRSDWVAPFQLETILLSSCKLGPLFPTWLKTQVNYSSLDLSYTGISDAVPHWFWNLSSNFGNLDLSHNDLRGMVPNLLQLNQLTLPFSIDLSSNSFEGPVPLFPSNLDSLDLSNNSFSGPIPEIIGTVMQSLSYFSLSINNIEGPVPSSMCRMIKLRAVDLSRNHLSKELPDCWQNLTELLVFDMSSNELTGVLPSTVCSIKGLLSLHLEYNNMNGNLPVSMKNLTRLITLDLGSNEFTGGIPSSIGHELPNLKVLSLRSNRFHGHIPPQLSNLSSLQILDLSHNSFLGTIPPSFGNFSSIRISPKRLGKIVNVGSYEEAILLVTKNRENFYGKLLSIMTTLDLSDNNLSGQIPEQITSLLGLWNLNLSGNHLTGEITHKFSQLIELESLDLSRNQLSGSIPPALSNLTFLSHFNVSYNNLTGRIPSGNQLNTFTDPSAFMGNPFLCGFPLNNSCDKVVTDGAAYKNKIETHNHDAIWMYISVVLGFVLGFWVVWGVLLFSEASRHSYFRAVDGFFDRVYVSVVLNFRSIKRKVLNRKQGVA